MIEIGTICDQVASLDVPVLILGESGVGKEVLARYLHLHSGRHGPFVKVNCAAIPADLLEAEFFGYERGAFTGALTSQPGKFTAAGKGTLVLDEIAEMHPLLQAKLLHVLQDGQFMRLGGTRTVVSEARVIAATNLQIEAAVASGRLREDLLFRLNVVTLDVPPLRSRPEDIPALCGFFVDKYSLVYQSRINELPSSLVDAYQSYHWPGNIRELENAVRRFLIMGKTSTAIAELKRTTAAAIPSAKASLRQVSAAAAEKAERELILKTLTELNWNRRKAATQLNICYKSLLNKLRLWQMKAEPAPNSTIHTCPQPLQLTRKRSAPRLSS